jgi:2-oxoglutarate/2-oxoacid ferredoxin oxidoreductase subunit beta
MGDGSATIGMQHIIDSAHNNDDMTVVIHNNMLYGMTGGQPSEFTPRGFKTPTLPGGAQRDSYDICEVATAAGANYVRRIYGIGDFSDEIAEAVSRKGFSLIEVMEICPSYGVKANPGVKLKEVCEQAGLTAKLYIDRDRPVYVPEIKTETCSLISSESLIEQKFQVNLLHSKTIMIAGSAGEGVQAAAEFLSKTAIACGLSTTKKGSYPVTVGIGFSASQVIISPDEIVYTGFEHPDILLVSSDDGLGFVKKTIAALPETSVIYAHTELEIGPTKAQIIKYDFRTSVQARNISLYSLFCMLQHNQFIPIEAFLDTVENSKIGEKTDMKKLFKLDEN